MVFFRLKEVRAFVQAEDLHYSDVCGLGIQTRASEGCGR